MAQSEYMTKICEIVKILPRGWQTEVTGGEATKKVLLRRALQRCSILAMSPGEHDAFNMLLEWLKTQKEENKKFENEIKQIVK